MKVGKFNKQRGVEPYKWKIKTEENRQGTDCGKKRYADF
jgi:hypothetical protein